MNDDNLYLDVEDLRQRGWTESLIQKFLSEPDRSEPVSHWANSTGKRTYFLERVETAEASDDFRRGYEASLKRRKVDPGVAAQYLGHQTRNDWSGSSLEGTVDTSGTETSRGSRRSG